MVKVMKEEKFFEALKHVLEVFIKHMFCAWTAGATSNPLVSLFNFILCFYEMFEYFDTLHNMLFPIVSFSDQALILANTR